MKVIRAISSMAEASRRFERRVLSVGLVPTMGALHDGHMSLIRAAVSENRKTIVTVFVNPLQFAPKEDFKRYPRSMARDMKLLRDAGVDILFAPNIAQMYPRGFQTSLEVTQLSRRWEGAMRPGHFRGVATVVMLLMQLTRPSSLYLGQKDYQQALILERMACDLRLPVRVKILPIIREPDGLAMSSRNTYLSPIERSRAVVLYEALTEARRQIFSGERRAHYLAARMRHRINSTPGVKLDYIAITDARTLEPQSRLRRGRSAILVAARVGRTRLIDNLLVEVS